jgi:hypothetical protein
MAMNKLKLATAGAVLATPLAAMPAMAATCFGGESAPASFSCTFADFSFNGVTFTNITLAATVSGTGSITLGAIPLTTISPAPGEFGLDLNYTSNVGTGSGVADVKLTYTVAGNLLEDAFMSFTGTQTGAGVINLSENLGVTTLSLNGQGTATATFAPIASLTVVKDQSDFVGINSTGTASTSDLVNAFSLTTVPAPAALPLFGTGLVAGLLGLFRKKKARVRVGSATLA